MRRLGRLLLRVALRATPPWYRSHAGEEVVATYMARAQEARARGWYTETQLLVTELAGVAAVAVRTRRQDALDSYAPRGSFDPLDAAIRTPNPIQIMERLIHDVRFAVRALLRRPTATLLAVFTFGLGIAGAAAMFSVVNTVLLRPLPFRAPEEVMTVYPTLPEWRKDERLRAAADRASFSYPEYTEWRETQTSFTDVAAIARRWAVVTGAGAAEMMPIGRATPSLFTLLGTVPAAGRLFSEEENESEAPSVLISHGFWMNRFGGDPGTIGRTLRLNDEAYRIVGVLPDGFSLGGQNYDMWTAMGGPSDRLNATGMFLAGNHWLTGIGRLKPGVPPQRAQDELAAFFRGRAVADHPEHGANVVPRHADTTRNVRAPLLLLIGASILLLLVACASVASIVLGAAMDRESELAVRSALGAGRGRLTAQLLTESLVLAMLGGIVGVLAAVPMLRVLATIAPTGVPRIDELALDWRVLGFAFLITALCGILFGLFPALSLSRAELSGTLRSVRAVTARRGRMQSALVVAELAVATVLLVGAGLLARTMNALDRVDVGIDTERVLVVNVAPIYSRFRDETDPRGEGQDFAPYAERLLAELRAIPGVTQLATASPVPFSGNAASNHIQPEGYVPGPDETMNAERRMVSPDYFTAMGIPLVRGRPFTEAENREDAPHVVIVSERLAERYWPGQDPVGKRLGYWGDRNATVIGVAADVREADLTAPPSIAFYMPYMQGSTGLGEILLRTDGDPEALIPAVRDRITSVDPDLAISGLQPLQDNMRGTVAQQRFRARLVSAFAVLAALFAIMGVYGVITRSVARRTREMGVRMALGAERRSVLTLIVTQGMRLAIAGIVAGAVTAFFATSVLESFLFGVERADLVTYGGIALLLGGMTAAACLSPAMRATRVDPMIALRSE